MTDFTMKTDADGVAIITWDTVGKSMNVMNQQGFIDLDALIDQALADDAVKGIILTSGKDGSFAGGMDLNIIARMKESAGDNPGQGAFRRADADPCHPSQDRTRRHGLQDQEGR